jgi:glycosyltransferase involved in cell wall biosynthesis
MSASIAYDATRLFLGPLAVTPRGIDRVDLSYARFFFETWPGDCVATLPTPWGVRWFDRQRVIRGLARLEELWSETIQPDEDRMLLNIKTRLSVQHGPNTGKFPEHSRRVIRPAFRLLDLISVTCFSFGTSVIKSLPENTIYLNVGQLSLATPLFVSWLRHRPDVKPVFMLHDVIPLEHPEFCLPGAHRSHAKIIDNTARYASGLIVTSAAARDPVLNALRLRGRAAIPVETVPLPVAPIFLEKDRRDEELGTHDYFVVCGAIEPRKNHLLLLNVWRELVRREGKRAPKLVVVGSPSKSVARVAPLLRTLAESAPLQDQIIFAPGLSSPALRRLIAHAKALLMPSFAEGFGLPVIEALALGTPVIASDLPAHREIAGDLALYRDPTDQSGWLAAICMFADGDRAATEIRNRVSAYQPQTWREYFIRIKHFLKTFEDV